MIKDQTIDEALIEIMRTKKTLEALRKARKEQTKRCYRQSCVLYGQNLITERSKCSECNEHLYETASETREHAAAKRASMDLTRSLAKLRASK